jgi:hypothetical protein
VGLDRMDLWRGGDDAPCVDLESVDLQICSMDAEIVVDVYIAYTTLDSANEASNAA